jgi:hypothetical protein
MVPGPPPPAPPGGVTDEPDDEDANDLPDDEEDDPLGDLVEVPRRPVTAALGEFFRSTWLIWAFGFVIIAIIVYRGTNRG